FCVFWLVFLSPFIGMKYNTGFCTPKPLPPERITNVVNSMRHIDVNIDYLKLHYPFDFSTYQDVLEKIFTFTKYKLNPLL
ncbi:MAG: hypothetical protein ACK4OF_04610, partial [Aquificaceae bacterium]